MGNTWEVPVRNMINKSLQTLTEKGHNLIDMRPIIVRYDMAGHVAGKALYKHNLIKLNGGILKRYTEYFINHTVPHEVAHLVAFFLNGNHPVAKPHGNEWRGLMWELGLHPNRTHKYETLSARGANCERVKPYRYKCICREFMLSLTRHRRYMHGHKYYCRKCSNVIQYIGL